MSAPKLLVFSGGVGGAKLALGLSRVLPPERVSFVVNTGDDQPFHGLHVSPDLDTVMYTLSGLVNPATGWGVEDDTFEALAMLERYGADAWFRLGDKDLGTHIRRQALLDEGKSLSEATRELSEALGIRHRVVPMSDDPVRTVVLSDEGQLPFQTYFVRRRCEPVVRGLRFDGADSARPSPGFSEALDGASALVFGPSNPWLSVEPILAVQGVKERVKKFAGPRVAISPIVAGRALKGPAAKIMSELGYDVASAGIARFYQGLCDTLVIDESDEGEVAAVESYGMKPVVFPTVMRSLEDKIALARRVSSLAGAPANEA